MNAPQVKVANATKPKSAWRRFAIRLLTILVAATLIGVALRHLAAGLNESHQPAGFPRGFLQGALMPCALPNLLVGNDVTIYSQANNGVPYKLGYTCGVNACGALFFGIFFWRLQRLRKRMLTGDGETRGQ